MSFSPIFAWPVIIASIALLIIIAVWFILFWADENR